MARRVRVGKKGEGRRITKIGGLAFQFYGLVERYRYLWVHRQEESSNVNKGCAPRLSVFGQVGREDLACCHVIAFLEPNLKTIPGAL